MSGLYTSGDWHVRPGSEAEFIEAWRDLADWTLANVTGCTFAKLLRDDADPSHFVSFSPWKDDDAAAAWRMHRGFQERVTTLQGYLESFDPRSMRVVAEAGEATPDPW